MPLLSDGGYGVVDSERPFEAESCYYLEFQIISCLVSIKHLRDKSRSEDGMFDTKYRYYHYYTDHLLFSMGQITNRFVGNGRKEIDNKRRERNRTNFLFTDADFPILSAKTARNAAEHIDEDNNHIMENGNGVGGFNLIDEETPQELHDTLMDNRETHIYTLDLTNEVIYMKHNNKLLTVDIKALESELEQLYENVKCFKGRMNIPF